MKSCELLAESREMAGKESTHSTGAALGWHPRLVKRVARLATPVIGLHSASNRTSELDRPCRVSAIIYASA